MTSATNYGLSRLGQDMRKRLALRFDVSLALALAVVAPAALAIEGGNATSGFAAVGTGVQLHSDWVVTARHAVLNPGDTYSNGFGNREVAARYDAPGSGAFPAHDLALLRLVPAASAAGALPVEAALWPAGPVGPWQVTVVSAANHGPARGFGYATVDEFVTSIDPDDGGPLGPVPVNYLLSHDSQVHVESADSGGGLFWGHVADSGLLLGISSGLLTDALDQPAGSAFVHLASYRSWIDGVMAADLNDTQTVLWVSVVPEPASWALMGLGVLGLAAAAKRQHRGGLAH